MKGFESFLYIVFRVQHFHHVSLLSSSFERFTISVGYPTSGGYLLSQSGK